MIMILVTHSYGIGGYARLAIGYDPTPLCGIPTHIFFGLFQSFIGAIVLNQRNPDK